MSRIMIIISCRPARELAYGSFSAESSPYWRAEAESAVLIACLTAFAPIIVDCAKMLSFSRCVSTGLDSGSSLLQPIASAESNSSARTDFPDDTALPVQVGVLLDSWRDAGFW